MKFKSTLDDENRTGIKYGELKLFVLAAFAVPFMGLADLDESKFDLYQEGDLSNQNHWVVEGAEGDKMVKVNGRVMVGREGEDGVPLFTFNPGSMMRIRKRFPSTTGRKVTVTFSLKPGASTLGGRFYFGEDSGSLGLQFARGTVHVWEGVENIPAIDTKARFKASSANQFELKLDFDAHRAEVFMNGAALGAYKLVDGMKCLNTVNLYAGGPEFSSEVGGLRIVSVDHF